MLTVKEAQELLGVSKAKMTRLISNGTLHATPDPLDSRYKLIPRSEVEALKAQSQRSST